MNELLVFAKAPRVGEVKTRLATTIGTEAACDAYKQLVSVVGARLHSIRSATVCFSPVDAEDELRSYFSAEWKFRPQVGFTLGERLQGGLAESFATGAQRVAVIGTDCPYLCAADIENAWNLLGAHDAAIGPAEDGGYWLLGLKAPQPELFADIAWGTSSVLRQTLDRAERLGLKVATLRTLADVDTASDWEHFLRHQKSGLQG